MRTPLMILAALLFLFTATCLAEASVNIVCTCFPCYDFARAVCGDDGHILQLIRPGTEVHTYDPSPADIFAISECDLFIYIGGESDEWVTDILESLDDAPRALRLFDTVEGIEEEHSEGMTVHESSSDESEYDEHIWTSPANAQKMILSIQDALCSCDPDEAPRYTANAAAYIDAVSQLDSEIRSVVSNGERNTIIFADRFPLLYFVREYGLNYYAAFPSCAAESDPSAQTVAFLIDKVREESISAIYVPEMSSERIARTIQDETGADILTFYSLQNVSAEDFANGETYISLMKKNIDALQKGLN